MSATRLRFGDFAWICNRATLTLCPALGLGDPECYSRNIAIGRFLLFEPAVLAIDLAGAVMTLIMIYYIRSKYTAVGISWRHLRVPKFGIGRKEIVMFFYAFFVDVVLEFLLLSNIIPFGSSLYLKVAAAHIASITTTCVLLLLNGFVGFQWLEDGSRQSIWTFRLIALVTFACVYMLAFDTFSGLWLLSPNTTLPLFIVFVIFNGAAVLLYTLLQFVLVCTTLESRWPIGNLILATIFFVSAMTVIIGFSNHVCHLAKHYVDGMFLGATFLLMSAMMIYKYWDSITAEDWEFNLGGAPHIWHMHNTMDLVKYE